MVESRTPRYGQPLLHVHIVLHKRTGRRERVGKLRHVVRGERVTVQRRAHDHRVPPELATHGHLSEERIVRVTLAHLAERVVVRLPGAACANGDDVRVRHQRLSDHAHIVASGVERFPVRRLRRVKQRAGGRAARACFPCRAGRHKERRAAVIVPK